MVLGIQAALLKCSSAPFMVCISGFSVLNSSIVLAEEMIAFAASSMWERESLVARPDGCVTEKR